MTRPFVFQGSALVTAVGLSAAMIVFAPAVAAVAAPAQTAVPCVVPGQQVPAARRLADTTPVTRADLAAVPASVGAEPFVRLATEDARRVGPPLAKSVKIPVYVHVIKGTRKGERTPTGPKRVRRLIAILNGGFHGLQAPDAPSARYTFELKRIDYTRREGWYHAYLFGPRDQKMKRALHRGGSRSLNLYLSGGGPSGQPVLGWSRFPWQYHATPRLDSVTVNYAAMPGGKQKHYNLGDTVIHETGHWLGLFHTFQGGCKPPGDQVSDTPAEGTPSYYCVTTSDTCPDDPGLDPVHNFMDYSYDTCMNSFTPHQLARMDWAFAKYRR